MSETAPDQSIAAAALLSIWSCVVACDSPPAHPMSMGVDAGAFAHALAGPETDCASCHPKQVAEWRTSSHAYAMKDPVFHAMVRLGQQQTQGALGDFCVQCHSPIGKATGQTTVERNADGGLFVQKTEGLTPNAMDGVSCLVCHSITRIDKIANASFEMDLSDIRRGPISDPDANPAHRSAYSPLHEDTEICGTCHVVQNTKKVVLEQTHIEWVQSAFNGTKTCQDCHMPSSVGAAAAGHRDDRVVHDHRFVGVDVSLLPAGEFPGGEDSRARVERLLRDSASFSLRAANDARRLDVDIGNLAGHALPSGATADRELWVELIVSDSSGHTVFESGTLDERADLRVDDATRTTRPGSDPALVLYTQKMLSDPKLEDPSATALPKTVDFLWEPNAEEEHLIRSGQTVHEHYAFPALAAGRYEAKARLLFRAFPPHLLRKLESEAGLDPSVKTRVQIVEVAAATAVLSLR